jgi:hypothetical protein
MTDAVASVLRSFSVPPEAYSSLKNARNVSELVAILLPFLGGRDMQRHVAALKALAEAGLPGRHAIAVVAKCRPLKEQENGWPEGSWLDVLMPLGVEAALKRLVH